MRVFEERIHGDWHHRTHRCLKFGLIVVMNSTQAGMSLMNSGVELLQECSRQ